MNWRMRQALAAVALAAFGAASLATSRPDCPRAVALSDEGAVDLALPMLTERYRTRASSPVSLLLHAQVSGEATVALRAVAEPPARLFQRDGGPAELVLGGATNSVGELKLAVIGGECADLCEDVTLAVVVEHLGGPASDVRWELVAEMEDCSDDAYVRIDTL